MSGVVVTFCIPASSAWELQLLLILPVLILSVVWDFFFLTNQVGVWCYLIVVLICTFWMKNWCFWTVVLEKALESSLDCKEIQLVHPKGNQSWVFIGRTDVEAETPILWPPDAKNWLIGKDPDAGRDWGREEKGTTEDKMADGITGSMDMSLSELRVVVIDREAWRAAVHGVTKSRIRLSDWTELNWMTKGSKHLSMCIFSIYLYFFFVQVFCQFIFLIIEFKVSLPSMSFKNILSKAIFLSQFS